VEYVAVGPRYVVRAEALHLLILVRCPQRRLRARIATHLSLDESGNRANPYKSQTLQVGMHLSLRRSWGTTRLDHLDREGPEDAGKVVLVRADEWVRFVRRMCL